MCNIIGLFINICDKAHNIQRSYMWSICGHFTISIITLLFTLTTLKLKPRPLDTRAIVLSNLLKLFRRMDLSKSLEKISQISTTQDRLVAYKELVNECISKDVPDQIQHLIDHLMQESVQPVLSRPSMEYLCVEIGKLKDEPLRALCQYAIAKIEPRVASFDVADETVKNQQRC